MVRKTLLIQRWIQRKNHLVEKGNLLLLLILLLLLLSYVRERAFVQHIFVLCSKNCEVMKLAATRYDETIVDMHPFLILNMEKPKILNGIFFGDNNNNLYKLFLQTIIT